MRHEMRVWCGRSPEQVIKRVCFSPKVLREGRICKGTQSILRFREAFVPAIFGCQFVQNQGSNGILPLDGEGIDHGQGLFHQRGRHGGGGSFP